MKTNKWYFVNALSGENKKGNKYQSISISNGIRTVSLFTKSYIDVSGLNEGDPVDPTFALEITYRNELQPTLISLKKL